MATKKDKKVATKVDATQITKVAAVGASAVKKNVSGFMEFIKEKVISLSNAHPLKYIYNINYNDSTYYNKNKK